jgi:nitronate monooxygenase
MGTRFIATKESAADSKYKKMVCDSHASDIVYTAAVSGVPANFLSDSLNKAGFDVDKLRDLGAKSGKLKAIKDEAKAWKTIWSAGHGVSNIDDIPKAGSLVKRLRDEYEKASNTLVKSVHTNAKKKKLPNIKP